MNIINKVKQNKGQNGFTIIELMVAIFIMVIILAITSQLFIAIVKMQIKNIAIRSMQEEVRLDMEALNRQVEEASEINYNYDEIGNPHRLSLLYRNPVNTEEYKEVEFYVEDQKLVMDTYNYDYYDKVRKDDAPVEHNVLGTSDVVIDNLEFDFPPETINSAEGPHPYVTLKIESHHGDTMGGKKFFASGFYNRSRGGQIPRLDVSTTIAIRGYDY